jgi:hypothetical protein
MFLFNLAVTDYYYLWPGTCPVLCSNNGEYVEGACRCFPGWKGAECSIRSQTSYSQSGSILFFQTQIIHMLLDSEPDVLDPDPAFKTKSIPRSCDCLHLALRYTKKESSSDGLVYNADFFLYLLFFSLLFLFVFELLSAFLGRNIALPVLYSRIFFLYYDGTGTVLAVQQYPRRQRKSQCLAIPNVQSNFFL